MLPLSYSLEGGIRGKLVSISFSLATKSNSELRNLIRLLIYRNCGRGR